MAIGCSSADFESPIRPKKAQSSKTTEKKVPSSQPDRPLANTNTIKGVLFAPLPSQEKGVRDRIIELFEKELLNHTETEGANSSPQIRMVLAPANLKKEAYCAATVSWLYVTVGVKGFKYSAWSPNLFPANRVIYRRNDALIGFDKIQKADVAGYYVAAKKRIGHVGVFQRTPEPKSNWCFVAEGNTSQQHQQGFFIKVRSKREIYMVSNFLD
ncbi:MAG: hypothetical protein U0Y10_17770 [Spirosomataceae bacterium]